MFKEQLLKKALKLYAGEHVLARVLKYGEQAFQRGGEGKFFTIYVQDVDEFTARSQPLAPEEIIRLLNEYLSTMTSTIHSYGGIIEKYVGSAITAMWGFDGHEQHAQQACECALQCLRQAQIFNAKWSCQGIPAFTVRIGINTGHVVLGNVGSEERLCYMVLGDQVNLATRLQAVNTHFGTHILISHMTQELLNDRLSTREVDTIQIKGKREPITLYTFESIQRHI